MLVDKANIVVRAGDGGDGCISFRREKYVPRGGPDGGDGGNGGSVILVVHSDLDGLRYFQSQRHFKGENGGHGRGGKKHGRNGRDLCVKVPPGTIVYDGSETLIADLVTQGVTLLVARGGKGGRGNVHFATASDRTPHRAEPGGKGEERNLYLEFKLVVDVAILGFPSVGKSTLLSRFSNLEPRIADYPFTTTSPLLGVAQLSDGSRLTLAEIPAITEGSHKGKGLGLEHLKHAERAKVLLFLLDASQGEPNTQYENLKREIDHYDPQLLRKPRVVALNKMDAAGETPGMVEEPERPVHHISALQNQGLASLLSEIRRRVEWEERREDPEKRRLS